MQRLQTIFTAMLLTLILVNGCTRTTSENSIEMVHTENSEVWLEEGLEFEGVTIAFGYRGRQVESGDWLEPTVAITRGGKPVADAMVFYQLVSSDGPALGDEVATVFEPASAGKPACYAQGKLRLPREVRSVDVRVRIVLPEIDQEWTQDFTF